MRGHRKLVAAGSSMLVLAACGGGNSGQEDPDPAAISSNEPTSAAGDLEAQIALAATSYQAAVDALVVGRARALAERSAAADQYNEATGSAEESAFSALKDSCKQVADTYRAFQASLRAGKFADTDRPDVDTVLTATQGLIAALDKYSDAPDSAAIKDINTEEVTLTEKWSEAVDALATRLGARGLPGNVPAAPPGERISTSEFSLVVPPGMEGHPSVTLHVSTPDEIVAINAGTVLDSSGRPMTTELVETAEDACTRATKEMGGVDREGISDTKVGPERGKTCIHDLPNGVVEQMAIVRRNGKIYLFTLNAPKKKFDEYSDEFRAVLDGVEFL